MTASANSWWNTPEWYAYERAYGNEPGTRVRELAEATWLTHVVDLTQPEEELWNKIPKTMRQAINKGLAMYQYFGGERQFDGYEELHREVAGLNVERPVRASETYDCQGSWVASGLAYLIVAEGIDSEELDGAILVIRYGGWSYYASGPSVQPHVMPALIWRAMIACKTLGDRWFEVGWLKGDTEKERSIAKFKSRWGGENKPANWLAMEGACEANKTS